MALLYSQMLHHMIHKFVTGGNKPKPATNEQLDTAWLQGEVSKYFNGDSSMALGLSLEDLTSTVFDVLTSPKSDTELQNDVSNLFDRVYCFHVCLSVLHPPILL